MSAVRFVVRGRVQGVGFRWFVQRTAAPLKVRGWVSNQGDGSVEVVVEGDAAAVASLEAAIRRGPPHASVSGVEKNDVPHDIAWP
ncbi:MAG TPA: acylphosphatase, partial [Gemmatimonadales bacterium]|nr:acylphosphatase [Gemmatimonadales bacterium]